MWQAIVAHHCNHKVDMQCGHALTRCLFGRYAVTPAKGDPTHIKPYAHGRNKHTKKGAAALLTGASHVATPAAASAGLAACAGLWHCRSRRARHTGVASRRCGQLADAEQDAAQDAEHGAA